MESITRLARESSVLLELFESVLVLRLSKTVNLSFDHSVITSLEVLSSVISHSVFELESLLFNQRSLIIFRILGVTFLEVVELGVVVTAQQDFLLIK